MKLLAGILITLAALTSQAQTKSCTLKQVEKEAKHFLAAMSVFDVRDIQSCLEISIQKQLTTDKYTARNFVNERLSVLQILAEINQIKHAYMTAVIKCETTNTPGCGSDEDWEREELNLRPGISAQDEDLLNKDADEKNADIEKQRANGTRDW